MVPNVIRLGGTLDLDVSLAGTPRQPRPTGTLDVKEMFFRLEGDLPGLDHGDVKARFNPEEVVIWPGNTAYVDHFGTVASAPNTSSLDGGRRSGNQRDYQDFLRLMQSLNILHFTSGYPVEPIDLHASVRHLHCLADCVRLTDKVFHAYSLGRDRNRAGVGDRPRSSTTDGR